MATGADNPFAPPTPPAPGEGPAPNVLEHAGGTGPGGSGEFASADNPFAAALTSISLGGSGQVPSVSGGAAATGAASGVAGGAASTLSSSTAGPDRVPDINSVFSSSTSVSSEG